MDETHSANLTKQNLHSLFFKLWPYFYGLKQWHCSFIGRDKSCCNSISCIWKDQELYGKKGYWWFFLFLWLVAYTGIFCVFLHLVGADHVNLNLSGNTTVDNLSPGSVAIASSVSKVFASVITYPHEVYLAGLFLLLNCSGWPIAQETPHFQFSHVLFLLSWLKSK